MLFFMGRVLALMGDTLQRIRQPGGMPNKLFTEELGGPGLDQAGPDPGRGGAWGKFPPEEVLGPGQTHLPWRSRAETTRLGKPLALTILSLSYCWCNFV